ncbi:MULTISPECIES: hypothetical protein [Reichenbachiella]|uniref:Outer membrane protein beta-barrel domain-containing protein n=1 Tax=Reichenbachiella agariperforans TaxID=156994 RepID=A0A1M6WS04_REIAG|nr:MULTISPECIES: hypothetical protein [Reichenbachiella]RJE71178.1 hypothetical protein BGP76_08475 [Reichenbachiella sp. MSK19-1]SHK96513.1 hypothetical protein SAMN04488028_11440 [Reichenbachiella agariperforans]
MKRLIIIVCIGLLSQQLYGQQRIDNGQDEIKSLIRKGDSNLTGFGSLDFKAGTTKDEMAMLIGVHGGVLIDKHVILGAGAYGWAVKPSFSGVFEGGGQDDLELNGGYAGVLLGYKLFPKSIVHVSFPVLLGGGNVQVIDPNYFFRYDDDTDFSIEQSNFFVADGATQLELNVSHAFRLGIGVGYRYVNGTRLDTLTDEDLSGFYGMVSVQLGYF